MNAETLTLSDQAENQGAALPPPVTAVGEVDLPNDGQSTAAKNSAYHIRNISTKGVLSQEPQTASIPITPSQSDLWNLDYENVRDPKNLDLIKKSLSEWSARALDFKWNKENWRHEYVEAVSIVAGCKPQDHFYPRLVRCGVKTRKGHLLCNYDKLCPVCAEIKAKERSRKLNSLFYRGTWAFCTISFKTFPCSGLEPRSYWNACKKSVNSLLADVCIEGAMVREELKLENISPITVNPHMHVILFNPQRELDWLENEVRLKTEEYLLADLGSPVSADVDIRPIKDEAGYWDHIRYINKPLQFVEPYRSAQLKADKFMVASLELVNVAMRGCLEWFVNLTKNRCQFYCLGSLDIHSRNTVLSRNAKGGRPKGCKDKAKRKKRGRKQDGS